MLIKEKILKQTLSDTGYLTVKLSKTKSIKTEISHRIVAITFLGEPTSKHLDVNHINHIRTDNRVENLEWCTRKENMFHARKEGRIGAAKLSVEDVIDIKKMLRDGSSGPVIAHRFGVTRSCINAIRRNETWTHIKI
jgi:hypothetical protein